MPNIVYNHTDQIIMIVTRWGPNPFGYYETNIALKPSEGVDLDILGLYPYPVEDNAATGRPGG